MGGVVYDLHILAEGLSLLGHEVLAFDPGQESEGARPAAEFSEVWRVFKNAKVRLKSPRFLQGANLWLKHRQRYKELKTILEKEKIDVIVLYSAARNGLQTIHLAAKYKIPVVFRNVDMLHKLWPTKLEQTFVKMAEKYVYKRADYLLALTPKYADYLVNLGARRKRVDLLLFPIDVNAFSESVNSAEVRSRWELKGSDKVIVFIGTLYEFGGMADFIRLFPQILNRVPEARLLIVGDGPLRPKLEEIIRELKLHPAVRITGYEPFSKMPQYVSAAQVCLNAFPINSKTCDIFSAKIVQYLACGKPAVSSALPGITTLIPAESSGVVYADTFQGLADEVIRLLQDEGRSARLGQAGLGYIRKSHEQGAIIKRMEQFLKRVGTENHASA